MYIFVGILLPISSKRKHVPQSKTKAKGQHRHSNGTTPTRVYKPMARTKITNGVRILPNVDGRTFWVRRFRDVNALHLSDLGGSGQVSEAEQSIVRRAALLTVELERLEMLFAEAGAAEPKQLDAYQRCANTLRRLLQTVGLQRRQRDVTPSLAEYLAKGANCHRAAIIATARRRFER
jgi:hypothetical protein